MCGGSALCSKNQVRFLNIKFVGLYLPLFLAKRTFSFNRRGFDFVDNVIDTIRLASLVADIRLANFLELGALLLFGRCGVFAILQTVSTLHIFGSCSTGEYAFSSEYIDAIDTTTSCLLPTGRSSIVVVAVSIGR